MLEDRQLSQMFLRKGLIDDETLKRAQGLCESSSDSLYEVLIREKMVDEERAIVAVSRQINLPCVSLNEFDANPKVLALIPQPLAEKFQLMPLGLTEEEGKRYLYVAMANPLDIDAIDEVGQIAGVPVKPLLAGPVDIKDALGKAYEAEPDIDLDIELVEEEVSEAKPTAPAEPASEGLGDMLDGLFEKKGFMEDLSFDDQPEKKAPPKAEVRKRLSRSSSSATPAPSTSPTPPSSQSALGALSRSDATPVPKNDATPVPKEKDDMLGGFSLDFGDLGLSLPESSSPPKEDIHQKMTLPAGTELPAEALSAAPAGGFARQPTKVKKKDPAAENDSQVGFSLGSDWSDLGDLASLDNGTPKKSETGSGLRAGPSPNKRTDTSTIRYVADPSLQRQAERGKTLGDIPSTELIRSVVYLLIQKGVLTEDEIRDEVRKRRQKSRR